MNKLILLFFLFALSSPVALGQAAPDADAVAAMQDLEATINEAINTLIPLVVLMIGFFVARRLISKATQID